MSSAVADTKMSGNSFIRGVRAVPAHGFTPKTAAMKRFRENTTSLAVTVGFVLPTLNAVNKRLEKFIDEGTDVSMEEMADIFVDCGKESAKNYCDRLARVAVQSAFAGALIVTGGETADKMVYLWDLYPRLPARYVGDLFARLRLPRFFAALLGAAPTPTDVTYLEAPTTPAQAFVSSMQRNTVFIVSDIVVDTARIAMDTSISASKKPMFLVKKALGRIVCGVCWASGAALGRIVGGEKCEYWCEYAGTLVAPSVTLQLIYLIDNVTQVRKTHHRSHTPSAM